MDGSRRGEVGGMIGGEAGEGGTRTSGGVGREVDSCYLTNNE